MAALGVYTLIKPRIKFKAEYCRASEGRLKTVIGIDPGKHTGVAISEGGKIKELFETNFWGAVDLIGKNQSAVFVIELSKNKRVHHKGAVTRGAIERTGVNVGSVIRESELLIEYIGMQGSPCIIQSPKGKLDAEQFKRITGWEGRTNQHQRDAAMLCWELVKRCRNG